ncbi:MAG: bacterioferritin-associated ferredoxin [Mariniblastus sp.]
MNPEDPVCLCFHVTRRKVVNFIRVEKPRRPSQLSECFGAGTGCGWCRPYLERIMEKEIGDRANESKPSAEISGASPDIDAISSSDYARSRSKYVREGGGKPPPGAAPIDEFGGETDQ